ncbi:MAG TPA: hypothetical protein VGR16_04635 [Thermomicrobiales bacterium]|nr:hypothetical protein [Thermomicrobiales bacterium]
MSMSAKPLCSRIRLAIILMIALLGYSPYASAQDGGSSTQACSPLAGEGEEDEATRAPEVEAACATAAAIITAALETRNGTPDASPEVEPSGEVAVRLPPANIPSTNERGYNYQLEAALSADLNAVRLDAPVYRLVTEPMTESEVAAMAQQLGITGDVESRGGDVYAVSGNGELFVTPGLAQYLAPHSDEPGELPADEQAVVIARDWLMETGLAPPDLGPGHVITRSPEAGRVLVQFDPLQPERLLAAYPSILVTLGNSAEIVEARVQWPEIEQHDLYRLRTAESAWRDVEAGRAYIEAPLEGGGFEQGSEILGTALYDDIAIGYTTSGPPGGEQFLQPVYIFSGQLTPEGSLESYPIAAYVPALPSSGTPAG